MLINSYLFRVFFSFRIKEIEEKYAAYSLKVFFSRLQNRYLY